MPRTAGPSLVGLLQQSEMAIVLAASFALFPAPALRQLVWCTVDADGLNAAIEALRPVLQAADPRLQIEIVNGQRAWQQTFGELRLPCEHIGSHWLIAATLWADTERELGWRREALREACEFPSTGGGVLPIERREEFPLQDESGLNSAYAPQGRRPRRRADPDRDGCGLIWIAPEVPMLGEVVTGLLRPLGEIVTRHGFWPAVSMRPQSGRDLRLLLSISYDRRETGRDEWALACLHEMRAWLASAGIGTYRTGVQDRSIEDLEPSERKLAARIAGALDPDGVFATAMPRRRP